MIRVRRVKKRRDEVVRRGATRPLVRVRTVPPEIPRPEYAETGRPTAAPRSGPASPELIESLRAAGRIAREVLDRVLAAVAPGVTTDALDALAHRETIARGAYPSPLNYRGFPRSLCTSVNDVICHGIPDASQRLLEGDLINCDVTVYYQGVHGDCSETVLVGQANPATRRLVEVTWECMRRGIEAATPGSPLNAIGRAIERVARDAGYSVVRDFTGHGIGERFHMAPQVLHYYEPRETTRIAPGMVFTVEPMINVGRYDAVVLDDDWTAITRDGSLSAQFEHTLLITETGPELLTESAVDPLWPARPAHPDGRRRPGDLPRV